MISLPALMMTSRFCLIDESWKQICGEGLNDDSRKKIEWTTRLGMSLVILSR